MHARSVGMNKRVLPRKSNDLKQPSESWISIIRAKKGIFTIDNGSTWNIVVVGVITGLFHLLVVRAAVVVVVVMRGRPAVAVAVLHVVVLRRCELLRVAAFTRLLRGSFQIGWLFKENSKD